MYGTVPVVRVLFLQLQEGQFVINFSFMSLFLFLTMLAIKWSCIISLYELFFRVLTIALSTHCCQNLFHHAIAVTTVATESIFQRWKHNIRLRRRILLVHSPSKQVLSQQDYTPC